MQTKIFAMGFLVSASWTGGTWARLGSQFRAMALAVRTRRLLAEMDERQLRDIGIGPAEARAEAARWPWDFGPHLLR